MPSIRLAVVHEAASDRASWTARLHRTTVAHFDRIAQFSLHSHATDLIVLSSSHDPKIVLDLLAAKIHVLLLADRVPSEGILDSLYSAATNAGVQLAVMNPDRYLPSRQLLRLQVRGTLGEAGLIRSHRWTAYTTENEFSDRFLRDLDSILWLAGRRPDRVFASASTQVDSPGRYLQVHLGFPGGGMALLGLTNRLPNGNEYASLSVIAANGAAYADDHHNMQLVYRGNQPHALRTDEHTRQYAAMAQEAIDSLYSNQDLSTGLTEWRNAWSVADAVERSIQSGQAVTLGGD